MNEQTRTTFLAVSVGIITGVGLLVGISSVVNNSLVPVLAKEDTFAEAQIRMERKLDRLEEKLATLDSKVDSLDKRISMMRLGGAAGDAQRLQQQPPQEDTKFYDIPVADSYILGRAEAPVTIVEFSDLQCPFCSRFHDPLMEAAKAYPNDVKVVFKHFPLAMHPNARPAAKAALAAGLQGKFYEMIGQLLQNQSALNEDKFKEIAGKLGLNVDQFAQDLKERDGDFEKKLNADMELGTKSNVPGTPTYFLNGVKTGARSAEAWKTAIEEALKAGKAPKK